MKYTRSATAVPGTIKKGEKEIIFEWPEKKGVLVTKAITAKFVKKIGHVRAGAVLQISLITGEKTTVFFRMPVSFMLSGPWPLEPNVIIDGTRAYDIRIINAKPFTADNVIVLIFNGEMI